MGDCPYGEMEWYCCKQEGHDGPHESVSLGSDITPSDPYVHVRYRLAESTDSCEIWRYESMPQSWLLEYITAYQAKGHDQFSLRILRTGEPWYSVP